MPPLDLHREIPFAEAHMRGPLFSYAGPQGRSISGLEHDGPNAVIDFETTGLSPRGGDRVVEVAIALVDGNGQTQDEFATLINPGRDTGPVFIHGISNDAVRNAPTFAEIVPELLARLEGAVIVAHNATFEEAFLASEFRRAGVHPTAPLPALCTLWLAQRTMPTPNHRLGTLCRYAQIPLVDKHAALGDMRATSALLPLLLHEVSQPLVYATPPPTGLAAHAPARKVRPVTRAVALRKGTNGWMTSLLDRLPMSAAEANDAQASSYLEALSDALADGRIIGDEARELARIAGAAGLGAAQVVALNDQLLDSIYQAAIEDEVLTKTEIRDLVKAAVALGRPDKFSHLTPTTPNGSSQKTQSETSTGRAGALSNESSRADRFHRALTAVEYQRSGESRENIAVSLGVSLATVKQLLRDGKWYLDPNSDGPRLALATAAADARNQGETQSAFQASQALSKGKTAEVWRDAAFLLGRDLTGMGGGSTAPGSGSRVTATGPTPSQR
ncbi:DNA polymerase-3 subunit epsilon [Kineosphaera limosa]|uniref:3'-5' exonuclease n=1 Tax=Kineosphaera limosa TaxID=111564 RepID=UPI0012FCEBC5|nr:3'-5' exonuclease [Kineosphaera limosa]NYD98981.1 DNA polymerase-3 subunit epsilon [Kineosphaera limosa]